MHFVSLAAKNCLFSQGTLLYFPEHAHLFTGSKLSRGMSAQCDGQKWDQVRHLMILDAVKAVLSLRVNVNDVSMVHE